MLAERRLETNNNAIPSSQSSQDTDTGPSCCKLQSLVFGRIHISYVTSLFCPSAIRPGITVLVAYDERIASSTTMADIRWQQRNAATRFRPLLSSTSRNPSHMDPSEDMENSSHMNPSEDIEQLKRECSAMISLMKKLEKEESEIRLQNEILAREALVNGFELGLLEAPAPKRRKPPTKKAESPS
jgi:hypothetical protein